MRDGYGSGYGYGYGYGDGYGYGYGSGSGSGSGHGHGHGSGDGYGSSGLGSSGSGLGDPIATIDIGKLTVQACRFGVLVVGCQALTLGEWRKRWREIAAEHNVSITDDDAAKALAWAESIYQQERR